MSADDRIIRLATGILHLWKALIDQSNGDPWFAHQARQAHQDTLNAMKNYGLIADFDLGKMTITPMSEPEDGGWSFHDGQIWRSALGGLFSMKETIGHCYPNVRFADSKDRRVIFWRNAIGMVSRDHSEEFCEPLYDSPAKPNDRPIKGVSYVVRGGVHFIVTNENQGGLYK